MKTKAKKCGIFVALAAVLLVTAMLVITCVDPVIPGLTIPQEKDTTPIAPPPGKTYIKVNIPANAARTLMPVVPDTLYYNVAIVSTDVGGETYGNGDCYDGTLDFGSNSEIFYVDPDEYTVSVSVHSSSPLTSTNLIAYGEDTVDVSAAGGSTDPIELKPFVDGAEHQGTFTHSITTDPVGATYAATIGPYPSGPYTTLGASGASLNSGYYWVRVVLSGNARYADAAYAQVLHIYGNQNTTWSPTLTLNKNKYDVIYNQNYGTTPTTNTDDNGTAGWTHNQIITLSSAYGTPTRSGFTFDGVWYKTKAYADAHTPAGVWTFASDKILKDTTLYAGWTSDTPPPTGNQINIDIVPYDGQDKTFAFSPASLTFTQAQILDTETPFVINITGSSSGLVVGGWVYGPTPVSSTAVLANAAIAAASLDISVITTGDPYTFTFHGTVGGVPYDDTFEIFVTAE